jgi:DHA1 family tetracycline resistance protein-like MFS transporter
MDQPVPQQRKAALGFIFATLLIDTIGFGIIIPDVPPLIRHLTGCTLSDAATYGAWLMAAYAAMQFLFGPLVGNLSDKYGRRPVLLCSLLGFGVDYLFSAFAPTIGWLFVGRVIAGITGASFTTASAYIADVSTPENRAANFGLVGVAFAAGFIIGPAIGGFLGDWNIHYPFIAAAILALLNATYGFFFLPESLAPELRRPLEVAKIIPGVSIIQLKKYKSVFGLLASLFLIYFAVQAVQMDWTYYTMYKFHWSQRLVGISLVVVGILVGAVQGGLIRVILPKFGQERCIWMGLLLYAIGLVLFGFADKSWMMFAFLVPYCLGGIAGPALQGYISSGVPANEQGNLQGGLTGIMSVTTIIGPWAMGLLFHYYTDPIHPHFPGAPFAFGGALMLLAALLAILSFKRSLRDAAAKQTQPVESNN